MTVKKLFKVYKKTLIIILLLVIVENVAWIIEPTVFGNVIDEFINKSYSRNLRFQSHHMQLLLMWILLYAINSISGTVRRRMEPKVFQNMNTDIAIKISEAVRENKIEPEKGAARAQLAEQIVSFFQFRIPEIIEQSITFGGAIIALTFIDWRISVVCLLVGVPLIVINIIYNKKVSVLQTELHDNYENVYETFSTKNPENVKNRFNKMGSVQRKIGNWSAINFGSLRLILLIIFIFVLYIAIDLDDFTTGKIYSIVAYLWSFIGTVEYLPDLMESAASLKDIKNRI
ncbi:MAG TPA: ABC transporter six-transmembrane domain-containing protein [Ignavibacteriaceae bacterium]|jgi:ABC-type multidrug transport system fused ATPase/permease subunit